MITALKKKFVAGGDVQNGSPASVGGGADGPISIQIPKKMDPTQNDTQRRRIRDIKSLPRIPLGMQLVNAELQKKFANGVNFNMKIIIRGDRNTGKTSLWKRLQGQPFTDEYSSTDEIQVTNVTWSYRTYDHIVKLDVWDVVDEGRAKKVKKTNASNSLKLTLNDSAIEELESVACDASVVDVYKGCNGVLLIFDVTKSWTWNYVQRELAKVPSQIPVLVLANKTDLAGEEQIGPVECIHFLRHFHRTPLPSGRIAGPIRFTQCSMKVAHGLRFLYNFFNIPFLFLQREYLQIAMDSNLRDIEIAEKELDLYDELGEVGKPAEDDGADDCVHRTAANLKQDAGNSVSKDLDGSCDNNATSGASDEKVALKTTKKDSKKAASKVVARKASSNSDSEQNHMVDMFEEDFDPDDQLQQQLHQFSLRSASFKQLESNRRTKDLTSALSLPSSAVAESEGQMMDINRWLSDLKRNESGSLKEPSKLINSLAQSTDVEDEEKNEKRVGKGGNPLVRRFSDELDDSGSDLTSEEGRLTGHQSDNVSDVTPSSSITYMLDDKSTKSYLGAGFTHINKATKKSCAKEGKNEFCMISASSTLTSMRPPKKTNKHSKVDAVDNGGEKLTKKTKRKTAETKKRMRICSSRICAPENLLVEDKIVDVGTMVVNAPAAADEYQQYDPL